MCTSVISQAEFCQICTSVISRLSSARCGCVGADVSRAVPGCSQDPGIALAPSAGGPFSPRKFKALSSPSRAKHTPAGKSKQNNALVQEKEGRMRAMVKAVQWPVSEAGRADVMTRGMRLCSTGWYESQE